MLYSVERSLAAGSGDEYRRHLDPRASVVVPGAELDREATIAAMDASPGWDEWAFDDERFERICEHSALISYRFRGRRGDRVYEAVLSSLYRLDEGGEWRLLLHQQTPLEGGGR
jgi:hypothetical protein